MTKSPVVIPFISLSCSYLEPTALIKSTSHLYNHCYLIDGHHITICWQKSKVPYFCLTLKEIRLPINKNLQLSRLFQSIRKLF